MSALLAAAEELGHRQHRVILTFHHVRPWAEKAFAPNRLLEITPEFLERVLGVVDEMGWLWPGIVTRAVTLVCALIGYVTASHTPLPNATMFLSSSVR